VPIVGHDGPQVPGTSRPASALGIRPQIRGVSAQGSGSRARQPTIAATWSRSTRGLRPPPAERPACTSARLLDAAAGCGRGQSDADTISAVPTIAVLDHHDRELAGRIRDLQRASYAVEAELIGFNQMPPLVETTSDIARLDLIVLGDVERETLRGLLGYRRDADVVDIDRLAVDPEYFRNGIGRALLEELHRRELDADRFEVSTGAANEPALALYRAVGYRLKRQEVSRGVRLVHLERAGPH
jgi:ribosomal protein S18 acetylase RimI-like enzyme